MSPITLSSFSFLIICKSCPAPRVLPLSPARFPKHSTRDKLHGSRFGSSFNNTNTTFTHTQHFLNNPIYIFTHWILSIRVTNTITTTTDSSFPDEAVTRLHHYVKCVTGHGAGTVGKGWKGRAEAVVVARVTGP